MLKRLLLGFVVTFCLVLVKKCISDLHSRLWVSSLSPLFPLYPAARTNMLAGAAKILCHHGTKESAADEIITFTFTPRHSLNLLRFARAAIATPYHLLWRSADAQIGKMGELLTIHCGATFLQTFTRAV